MTRLCNGPIKTFSKKQTSLANHTQEAECMEMSIAVNDARSMTNFMKECGFHLVKPTPLFEDNLSCCKLATEHVNTSRSKHTPLRHHVVKEQVMREKNFKICWCPTKWQLADMFTKSLPVRQFEELDRHIRGHADKDFEGSCQRVDPGVWGLKLKLDGMMNRMKEHVSINPNAHDSSQINSFRMMSRGSVAAVNRRQNVEAEGECENVTHAASLTQGKSMRQHGA